MHVKEVHIYGVWGGGRGGGMQAGEEFRLSSAQGTPRCLFLPSLNLPLLAALSHFLRNRPHLRCFQTFWTSEERCDDICKFLDPPSSSQQSRGLTVGTLTLWERWVGGCLMSSSSPSSPPPWPAVLSTCHQGLSQSDPPLKKEQISQE